MLSEAAAGGVASTVELLLKMGSNPNSKGEFQRTPLWRACFMGKRECVMPLLQGGADPGIGMKSKGLQTFVFCKILSAAQLKHDFI